MMRSSEHRHPTPDEQGSPDDLVDRRCIVPVTRPPGTRCSDHQIGDAGDRSQPEEGCPDVHVSTPKALAAAERLGPAQAAQGP